jgi:hypothetical protein
MPILLWIAFWSSMPGIATGWQETWQEALLPIRARATGSDDRPAE